MGDALGEAARVDEDEGRAVLADQLGEAVVDVAPLLAGGDGLEVGRRHLDRQVEVALVAEVDDHAVGRAVGVDVVRADEERAASSIGFTVAERPMRAGRSPATWSRRARVSERWLPRLSRTRAWISSTMTVCDVAQDLAAALGGEHEVERLGRGDQDVRRVLDDGLALGLGRVAGAERRCGCRGRS